VLKPGAWLGSASGDLNPRSVTSQCLGGSGSGKGLAYSNWEGKSGLRSWVVPNIGEKVLIRGGLDGNQGGGRDTQ